MTDTCAFCDKAHGRGFEDFKMDGTKGEEDVKRGRDGNLNLDDVVLPWSL